MGPGTRKPAERTNSGNLSDIFKFMLDQGAGTARGIYRGTVGLPGDLESLVRFGIGGEQYLPTSEDMGKPGKWYSAPPLNPLLEGENPYDQIGMFYNLPIYGGAAKAGVKGLKQFSNKVVGGPFDEGRRAFGKKAAAIGGAAALAPLIKLSEHLAPVTKQVDELAPAAKAATKHKFNSLKEYNDYLNSFVDKSRQAKIEEDIYNSAKNIAPVKRSYYTYAKDGSSTETFSDDVLNAFTPQAKAEMKTFKNSVIDPADEAAKASAPHWSELLDDYIKWNNDIPY